MTQSNIQHTSQHIDNQSFDEEFQMRQTALVKYDDPDNPTAISRVNPATEETLQAVLAASGGGVRIKKIDEALPYTYIGEASVGTDTSAASWRVKRIDDTNDPDSTILYAGTGVFDQVWDNRASLTYN